MTKSPKPFVFQLAPREIAELPDPQGSGDGAELCRMMKEQLATSGDTVTLTDSQMGCLLRHMVRNGDPFHEGMYRAFTRSLFELTALHLAEDVTRSG